jgi:hypothetical protein
MPRGQQAKKHPPSKMRSFRLQTETIQTLERLTSFVNSRMNIKISTTLILELLIKEAAKDNGERIVKLINKA